MTPDEFCRQRLDHVAEIERISLSGHLRMINGLKQQIAQFVLQIRHIATRNCICDLIGFLNGVRRNRFERLLQVPRTADLGRTQDRHDAQKRFHLARGVRTRRHGGGGR